MLRTMSLLAVLLINQKCKCANVGHKMESSKVSMETLLNLKLLRTMPDLLQPSQRLENTYLKGYEPTTKINFLETSSKNHLSPK
jgi:hypothetical protein